MKTLVKSLFALALTGIILSGSVLTSQASTVEKEVTSFGVPLADFNMLVVTGNVRITLVKKAQVKLVVGNEIDAVKTSFKQKGNTLYINSAQAEALEVTIYVNDLRRIDASKGASVVTAGEFNQDVLQVFLKDNATAKVKGNIRSLYTVTNHYSRLKLIGSAEQHILAKNELSELNTEDFAALKTEMVALNPALLANVKSSK